ncbi:MAG: BspA family leucine-rich repeat surface protein [Bacteroidales bacterium]|nr:BspA family leucine-rich repeat surface protein [Bacteroidales bacterium]
MRKIMFSAVALMALMAVSCQKDEKLNPAFTAHSENGDAKVSLNSNNYFEWGSTDEVAIFDGLNSAAVYSVAPRVGHATWAELTWQSGSTIGEGDYTAIYPASIALTSGTVELPMEQHSTDGSFTQFPMMATSSNLELQFSNLCAAFKVEIPATGHAIKRISITADNALCGQASIATASDGKPYASVASTGGRTVTLNIANPQNYTETHSYYIAMPAGVTYHQITMHICDDQGGVATKTFSSASGMTLVRNNVSAITFGSDLTFEQLAPATLKSEAFHDCPAERIVFHYNYFGDVTGATRIDDHWADPNATPIYQIINGTTYDIYTPASTINAPEDSRYLFGCYYDDFYSNLQQIDFGDGFNTSNVTGMRWMFAECYNLTSLDISSFNTANVSIMGDMFRNCSSLSNLNLSTFNTANVTNMQWMFAGCSSLTNLDLSSFNTENVTNMTLMFSSCSSLTSLDLSSFNTENVTNMSGMFTVCSSLTSLDLSMFNTENVTDMGSMFSYCGTLTSLDLSSFNTENVTNMGSMFSYCGTLTSLDLSSFNTENVTDMGGMFSHCYQLQNLNLSSFSSNSLSDISWAFWYCSRLKSLQFSSSFTLSNSCNVSGALVLCGTNGPTTIKCNSQTKSRLMTATPSHIVWDLY